MFWKLVWERVLGKSSCHSGRRTSLHPPRQTQCLIHFLLSRSPRVQVSLGAFLQRIESSWQGSGMGRAQRSSVQFSCSVVSPWTAARQPSLSITNCKERSNQSILKEISPECSLEGLMLKLKLQYFGHLMRRADSFEKPLTLGKIQGRGERDDRG